jgi:glycosyltransferase involved in cell wall biosynthesis
MATVLTCYYRPKPGGLCKRLFRAIESLLSSGHEVHYLAVVAFPISHPHCHFHRFPWPEANTDGIIFWSMFHLVASFQLLFLGFRYRVTHLFAFGHSYAFLLQPLRLLKRIPLTLFLRADALENHRHKQRSPFLVKLDGIIEDLAIAGVRLYGVSRSLTTRVIERHTLLSPRIAGTLPNNMPARRPRQRGQTTTSLPLRLACVGILEERKNQSLIIRCMAHIKGSLAHLYLFGLGADEEHLKNLTKELHVADRVTFMGWIDEVDGIWENVDLLLFPSLHEGAPNAILEALAYDIPILASDIPEHREILPQWSLLPTSDLMIWVKALQTVFADIPRSLEKLCEEQYKTASRLRFDWEGEIRRLILQKDEEIHDRSAAI